MLLYYQGLRRTGEFRSRGYRKVDGGRAGMRRRIFSATFRVEAPERGMAPPMPLPGAVQCPSPLGEFVMLSH